MSKKNINIIFDFDSTIIQLETIEVLAYFALNNIRDQNTILKNIENITFNAMVGKISFDKALISRISLLNINKSHIHATMKYLEKKLKDGGFKFGFEPIKIKFSPAPFMIKKLEETGIQFGKQLINKK